MKTALIDLSAIYWRFYHASEGEAQSGAKRMTLDFVRDLYGKFDDIKVVLDCPPYKRKEIYPEYKANRPPREKSQIELLKQTQEEILNDGWSMLTSAGAEADDIIGAYCSRADKENQVTIFGTDKDLLQVVGENITLFDKFNNKEKTPENTLGVAKNQVIDLLALCGDKSDNIPGLPRIGEKTAQKILKEFGNITGLINAIGVEGALKENFEKMLIENKEQLYLSRELVTLDLDCEIVETKKEVERNMNDNIENCEVVETEETVQEETAIVVQAPASHNITHEVVSYRQGLEPTGMEELVKTSQRLFDSGLYTNFRMPQAIMAIIMRGREIGIGATTALDCMSMIQGKPTMSAQLLQGLVMGSNVCEYFDCIETTKEIATFVTKRKGSKNETKLSFTKQDAEDMNLLGKDNYKKQLATMLRWRCSSALCRLAYSDVTQGIYSTEEMDV